MARARRQSTAAEPLPEQFTEQEQFLAVVRHWREQPDDFVRHCFNVEPDPWQVEALTALAQKGRVSIRSCHGPGKSALDAWAALWFMATHFPCRIPCTAPTAHQLHDILWSELAKWLQAMHPGMKRMYRLTSERLEWVSAPKESFAVARTSRPDQPEALQGFHCENLLFILDEASGIPEQVFEVAEGALTEPGALQLLTSNPTQTSGYFYDTHHKMRDQFYIIKVGAEDSPRVSDAYVESMARKYGRDSNVFRVRVSGEFPSAAADQLIPLDWLESAAGRLIKPYGEVAWGLDVARFGDDATALVKRRSNALLEPPMTWYGLDTMQTVGQLMRNYDATHEEDRPEDVYVDVIGIGSGVVDRLAEMNVPFSVHGVNVSESSATKDSYMRLRDELSFSAREWFESRNCTLLQPRQGSIAEYRDESYEELTAEASTIRYHPPTSTGKLRVFSKDEMKKLGHASPNRFDALMLTFAHRFTGKAAHRKDTYVRRRERRAPPVNYATDVY